MQGSKPGLLFIYWRAAARIANILKIVYYMLAVLILAMPLYVCSQGGFLRADTSLPLCYLDWLRDNYVLIAAFVALFVVAALADREARLLMQRYVALMAGELLLYDKVNMRKFLARYGLSRSRNIEEIEEILEYIENNYGVSIRIDTEENTIRVERG